MKPHLQTTVWTLLDAGASQREIERVTGIDRKTIRAYQKRFAAAAANSPGVATGCLAQFPPPRPPTLRVAAAGATVSACEPHRAFIEAQLRLRRNATAVYQDLVDQFGFTGAYGSVKRFVRHLRQREPEQFDRLEFLPGEEMQVDYGEGAPTRKPGTDRYRKPRLFVATLRYSRRCFRRVVWNSSQETWARLHEQAWRYFAGSCRYVVLDNLKEGVLKPDLYEPELNRETRRILGQAKAIGADAERLCQMLFAIEGRVGQRKLWGIVGLAERYPRRLVDCACAGAIADGIHSYRHVKALTEKLVADALAAIDKAGPAQGELALTQEHPLIRPADIYAELFSRCAAQPTHPSTPGGAKHDHQ